jgi:hypothetical protein
MIFLKEDMSDILAFLKLLSLSDSSKSNGNEDWSFFLPEFVSLVPSI